MKTQYSFSDVRKILEKSHSKDTPLIDAFDALSGVCFVIAPLAVGATSAATLPLIKMKNEK